MKFKIRILQPAVPPYRVALFEGVSKRYPGQVEILSQECQESSVKITGAKCDYTHNMIGVGPACFQKRMSVSGLKRNEDILIVCGEPRNLSMMWCAMCARALGIPFIWWGHHLSATSKEFRVRIRLIIMHLLKPSAILFYTRSGIDWLAKRGFDTKNVFATGNTIDQEPVKRAIEYWSSDRLAAFRRDKGIEDKKMVLFCSVLRQKTRLDVLITAMAGIVEKDPNVVLAIIGDGEVKVQCVELTQKLGIEKHVIWVGSLYDQMEIAPWFLSAAIFAYPGPIGLSIIHAFSYGLPVVVNDVPEHNGPEYEVMEPGKTGYVFRENDAEDLSRVLGSALSNLSGLESMGGYAKKLAYEKYTMENMVSNFCEAVEYARKKGRK